MLRKGQSGEITLLIVILLVIVGVAFGGYKLIGVAADYMAEHISDETEANLFGGLGKRQGSWKVEPETEQQKRAQGIFNKLLKHDKLRKLKYKLFFMPEKVPNAFAMPGGNMAVTDGLLDLVKSDVGLAMVIGHEFGHQQHRHSLKMMGRSLILAGVMMLIVGDAGFLVSLAVDMAEKSHSRDQETESDEYGVKMVHKIFGTTRGSLEFFEKISKEEGGGGGGKVLSMFSTHPYTPDRIERLKQMMVELEGPDALKGAEEPSAESPKAIKKAAPKSKKSEKKKPK